MPIRPRSATRFHSRLIDSASPDSQEGYVWDGEKWALSRMYGPGFVVPVEDGGTGASTAPNALTSLGIDTAIDDAFDGLLHNSPDYLHSYALFYDDFVGEAVTSGQLGSLGWNVQQANGGAVTIGTPSASTQPGIVVLANGTTSNSTGTAAINLSQVTFNGGGSFPPPFICEWRLRYSNIPGATDYRCRWGLLDSNDAADATEGMYFEVVGNGSNVGCIAQTSGAAISSGDTEFQMPANTMTRYTIVSDGGGGVTYLVNSGTSGTPLTLTTNLPLTADDFGPAAVINKVTSTTNARTMTVDYFYLLWGVTR